MSATGRPIVTLELPNGRKYTLETNIVPRQGDHLSLAALTYKVQRVTCVFNAVDEREDHFLVQLGGL